MSDTTPDEGFLAGDKPRQRHSLAGLPLGQAAPHDELLHPAAANGHYTATETSYYGFNIPERRLNGEIYLWFQPVLDVLAMCDSQDVQFGDFVRRFAR